MSRSQVVVDDIAAAWSDYPAAVRGGGFVFVSGVRGRRVDSATFADVPPEFRASAQGFTLTDELDGSLTADAWAVHAAMERVLAAAETGGDQILRQRMWQRDKRFFPVLERVRKCWQPEAAPSSGLGVSSVGGRFGRWYGIESIAVDTGDPNCLGRRRVLTPAEDADNPSASIYSQMVCSGPLVFLAGHIPIRTAEPGKPVVSGFDDIPEEGRFLATGRSHPDSRDGPIAAQSWFVYNEIRRSLARHGMSMSDIVHVRVYLADLRDFITFHRVHSHFFAGSAAPALCVVNFAEVGHKGCRIEIEPTALLPGSLPRSDVDWFGPAPFLGPAAVRAGPLLFLAGISGLAPDGRVAMDSMNIAADESSRELVCSLESSSSAPWVPAQIWWAWRRILDICAVAGLGPEAIAKSVVYLHSEADMATYEAIRQLFVPEAQHAFEAVFVPGPGPVEAAAVQIDAIALMDP